MSENIVFVPSEFYAEYKLCLAGYKPLENPIGFYWLEVDLDNKTFQRAITMHPGSVIMSAATILTLEVLEEYGQRDRSWMKHGRDYLFASCWIPNVIYVKHQLKGIREGINE